MGCSVWYCSRLKFFSLTVCFLRTCGSCLACQRAAGWAAAPCSSVSWGCGTLTDQGHNPTVPKQDQSRSIGSNQAQVTVQQFSDNLIVRRKAWGQARIWRQIRISEVHSQVQAYWLTLGSRPRMWVSAPSWRWRWSPSRFHTQSVALSQSWSWAQVA